MAQNVLDYTYDPTGNELMDEYLPKMAENCLTNNSGIARPTYAVENTVWVDTSDDDTWRYKIYDGTSDIVLFELDNITKKINFPNITGVFRFKGSVATVSALPATGNLPGDVYNVIDGGANYAWNGSEWDKLSENLEWGRIVGTLSNQTDLQNALNAKQATLVSGTNIKTVDGKSLLGSGNLTVGIGYGTSTTAATDVQKEVSIPSITTLNEGQIIVVRPSVTASGANITLKLNDFPAYPMRYNNAAITGATDSIVWNADFPSQFVFDGDYWVFLGHGIDTNTTVFNYSSDAGRYTAGVGTYAVSRYALIAQKDDGTWERLTDTTKKYTTATTKTVNTRGFILNQLRYFSSTSNYGNGAKIDTNVVYQKAASVDTAYSFNCSTAPGWTEGDYIYLVGTIGVDGLFYLDTTQWWSNALPSTNDGKLYIRLGLALTSTDATMSLFSDRPIFYHDGTKICEYKVADNKQDILVSGTNIKTINNTSLLGSGNIDIAGGSVSVDDVTISRDSNQKLQAIGVINSRDSSTAIKTWTGTKAQYDAILSKDANTEYLCTDTGEMYLGVVKICGADLNTKQDVSNLVTSVSSSSTDSQYPSAKLFYDTCGDIETLINAL